ncbi:flagellar biosynthesis protein FlhA [Thermanaerovibrio acidaminovorans DSM 6589]|uniref:Flagellar biosynthesis protein FlhA n=1 Tax=Thermanaerovibrio acidaminovorans (strain ATCC 49978 / DSM 6589 / Su883) TaxID=525903 RepID=D1B6A5_THEAS|nr:flagellar biosynthesis protein FlhA [Thermanaerovibrio acidaminovorans]ACZ19546.1 flagellar biosynthesis protein FlhA [Thermanaerovibrio acidaminovorans DSM 6589]
MGGSASVSNKVLRYADVGMAVLLVLIVGMMIIPLPTWLLDVLLALNITFGVVILLSTFYVKQALEIAAFPTILLMATLFRLALNVSTTRLVLLNGYAGEIINAFGNFVVGGNYVVGGVVFLILVIIQFLVITKGAERVAEVAARFTLDAMPGKQMAIDADLNAGMIDEQEARKRRANVQREADFYGAMDGASKFVKGDAIAGLIITAINILGGLAIGVLQRGMELRQALSTYSLLTVGDGLVAQIPALLLSTATGIIVTRAAGESDLGRDMVASMTRNHRPLYIGSGLLFALAVVPGLPTIPFALLGSAMAAMAYGIQREAAEAEVPAGRGEGSPQPKGAPGAPSAPPSAPSGPENVLPLLTVDPMEVEIGYALIPLVDPSQGGDILERIGTIRRQMAMDLGLVVPPIRIRDNIQLKPTEYVIRVKGAEVGRGELLPDHYLAMSTGGEDLLVGIPTKEPAFGLPALWISPEIRDQAEGLGYTVVDCPSVLATHLSEVIKRYGADLMTRQEVQKLVDLVAETNPAITKDLLDVLSLADVQKVLQGLIREQVSIRDLVTVFETLADHGRYTKSPDYLMERVREALSRVITLKLQDQDGVLGVYTLSPRWEQRIKECIKGDLMQGWQLNMPPKEMQELMEAVGAAAEAMVMGGLTPVLLTHPDVRLVVRRIVEGSLPQLFVVSYNEIAPSTQLRSLGVVE